MVRPYLLEAPSARRGKHPAGQNRLMRALCAAHRCGHAPVVECNGTAVSVLQRKSRFAALFKTYNRNSYVERQFHRFAEAVDGCDLFISVDETNGGVGLIPFAGLVLFTTVELVAFDLPNRTERGLLLWGNPDYAYHRERRAYSQSRKKAASAHAPHRAVHLHSFDLFVANWLSLTTHLQPAGYLIVPT